jgi:4-amino-4-deoxy-L-arabinose transferase-like glycosyltransferase
MNWLVALGYKVLGRFKFATRLWEAFGAWTMGLSLTGSALFGRRTGFVARTVPATSVGQFICRRYAMP